MLIAAKAAEKDGAFSQALSDYEQAAKQSPDSLDATLSYARLARKLGRTTDSIPLLERVMAAHPNQPEVLTELGFAYLAKQSPEPALPLFERAIAVKSSPSAWNGKGIALDRLNRHEEAQEAYRKALDDLADTDRSVRGNLGLSLVFSEKYKEAIRLLEPLAKRDDATPTMRQNLALAYGLSGRIHDARQLALRDLTPEQAQENLKYYQQWRSDKSGVAQAVSGTKLMEPTATPAKEEPPLAPSPPPALPEAAQPAQPEPAKAEQAAPVGEVVAQPQPPIEALQPAQPAAEKTSGEHKKGSKFAIGVRSLPDLSPEEARKLIGDVKPD